MRQVAFKAFSAPAAHATAAAQVPPEGHSRHASARMLRACGFVFLCEHRGVAVRYSATINTSCEGLLDGDALKGFVASDCICSIVECQRLPR